MQSVTECPHIRPQNSASQGTFSGLSIKSGMLFHPEGRRTRHHQVRHLRREESRPALHEPGKVLLAYSSDAVVRDFLSADSFVKYTDVTITSRAAYKEELV